MLFISEVFLLFLDTLTPFETFTCDKLNAIFSLNGM